MWQASALRLQPRRPIYATKLRPRWGQRVISLLLQKTAAGSTCRAFRRLRRPPSSWCLPSPNPISPGPSGVTPHYHTTPRPAMNTSMPAPTHAAISMHLLHSVHAKLRGAGLNSITAASQGKTTRAYLRQPKKCFNSGTNRGHTATNAPRRLLND